MLRAEQQLQFWPHHDYALISCFVAFISRKPFIDEAGILSGADIIAVVHSAWKDKFVERAATIKRALTPATAQHSKAADLLPPDRSSTVPICTSSSGQSSRGED